MKAQKNAFTLIELLLAMALLAVLALLLIGNFNTTLKRGRDAQRKNDLSQIQKALELYYEDNKTYPAFDIISPNQWKKLCTSQGCDQPNDTYYMIKVPNDPTAAYTYTYVPENTTPVASYYLFSNIENSLDQGSSVGQNGFTTGTGLVPKCDSLKTTINCKYYVSSSNADVLIPNP